jgi:hypothetical protein
MLLKIFAYYIVQTPLFDLTFPENNIFGTTAGPTKAVGHAYLIFLQPLSPGNHEIHFDQVTLGSPEVDSIINDTFWI